MNSKKYEFNQQSATRKLREEILLEGRVMITIDDQKIDDLFSSRFEDDNDIDFIHDGPDVYYIVDQNKLQRFVDYIESAGLDSSKIYTHATFKEDVGGNVTGADGAYNASLNVPPKKQNPFKENASQEYYIQVDIRDARKALAIIDDSYSLSNNIKKRSSDVYTTFDVMAAEELIDSLKQNGISSKNNVEGYVDEDALSGYTQDKSFRPGHTKDKGGFQYKDLWGMNESKQEWTIKNIETLINDYATGKKLTFRPIDKKQQTNQYGSKKTIYIYKLGDKDLVMIDDKAAGAPRLNDFKVVIGTIEPGTTILKNTLSVSKNAYTGMSDIIKMLDKAFGEKLNENYARFKNETKTRTESEQYHQAVKTVKKKVQEIAKLHAYLEMMQKELSETESGLKKKKYTELAIQKIKEEVKNLYIKTKKLK